MSGVTRKSAAEIALMRRAGAVVADVLALVEELAVRAEDPGCRGGFELQGVSRLPFGDLPFDR